MVAGEARQQIVGDATAPIDLPAGWPYDLVTQIISVKVNEAAIKAAEEAAKNAPDTTSVPLPVVTEVPVAIVTPVSAP